MDREGVEETRIHAQRIRLEERKVAALERIADRLTSISGKIDETHPILVSLLRTLGAAKR